VTPTDLRTAQTKSGDRGCLFGCIALLVFPNVGLVALALSQKGHREAATLLVGIAGLTLIVGIFAMVLGLSKDAGPESAPVTGASGPATAGATAEAIVAQLRTRNPASPLCHIVLFGDRPLTAKMTADESVLVFSSPSKAADFIDGYRHHYLTTSPLSVVAINSVDSLWALLNHPAEDPKYRPPYGLIVNFDYGGGAYHAFSLRQIQDFGLDGLRQGLVQVL
jgi:hypothetical protein